MPGLYLNAHASAAGIARPGNGQARYGDTPAPTTATQAAFGTEAAPASSASALLPNNPGGLAFWVGVAGIALLIGIYWSLPG